MSNTTTVPIYRAGVGFEGELPEVATVPAGIDLEDMCSPEYLDPEKLSRQQRMGRFLVDITAMTAHINDEAKGSEKPTHPVPGPSVIQGILKGNYAHGTERACVNQIIVMNKIQTFHVVTNELNTTPSAESIERRRKREASGLQIEDFSVAAAEPRQQRDVEYLYDCHWIAEIQLREQWADPEKKFEAFNLLKVAHMFKRRLTNGQVYDHQYIGIKECIASTRLCTIEDLMEPSYYAGTGAIDMGMRPFGCDYRIPAKPVWYQYHAVMVDGKIDIPDEKEVMGDAAYVL